MSLQIGQQLGSYKITSLLGKGGMGEVYRARDPRLNRDVAIKVSNAQFSERFEREAKVIASLNHPNICTLYDIGPNYLVMELIEGVEPKGPMPLDEALRVAQQIVLALEAAHEKGVTHRDLKPANIKIKSDGLVKVLDFGLAKHTPEPSSPEPEALTASSSLTESGFVVGSAAYMSPEQAQGKPIDKRSDIWSFGVVLYELLTGQRLFKGDSMADTLVQVMTKAPDWTRIPANVQPLLRRCLERDPHRRLRDIGDSMALLETASAAADPTVERIRPGRPWLLWSGLAATTSAAVMLTFLHLGQRSPQAEPVRLHIALPEDVNAVNRNFMISPDGRKLAFSASGRDGVARVWVRFMDSPDVKELPGSETTINAPPFFWDPGSRFIAYSGLGSKLKKVDLVGSPPQTLSDTTGFNAVGGSWNTDDVLIFGSVAGGLTRVSAVGGMPSPVTVRDQSRGESRHAFPTFLPDNRHFLYLRSSPTVPENSGVYIGSLDVKPEEQDSKLLLATRFGPAYVPSLQRGRGYVLFLREGTLWAQSFDEKRMELRGDPVSLAQQVNDNLAAGAFSASLNGVLVYRASSVSPDGRVVFVGREGTPASSLPAQPNGLRAVALSPDESRAALVRQDPANPMNRNIWTWDAKQGNSAQMTFDAGLAESPVWSADGSRIFYRSNRDGVWNLYRKLANDSKEDEVLLKTPQDKTPTGISRDGSLLLYTQLDPKTKNDVWVLSNPTGSPGKLTAFLNGESDESDARFSPEMAASGPRWVAYTSDESSRSEVWVREFPQGRKWQVSMAGGANPRWRGDGKELFFAAPDGTVMAVEVAAGDAFQPRAPTVLSKPGVFPNWDVSANGKRFLVLLRGAGAQAPFTVWQNWREGLQK